MRVAGCDNVVGAFLLLQLETYVRSENVEPFPLLNGRPRPVVSLEENVTKEFTCRMDGWKSVPVVTWYLNGKKQMSNQTMLIPSSSETVNQSFSSFVITTHRKDKELNCSATDPVTGRTENASVILNVQFKPEVVQMDAEYREHNDSGLFLALFVLVHANPPATITWVDESGHVIVNTSHFMILDTKTYPWLTNHTVHVQLSSLAKNYTFTAGNEFGATKSSFSFPDVKPDCDSAVHSESTNVKCDEAEIPRETISLQSNLRLNPDLNNLSQPPAEPHQGSRPLSESHAACEDLSDQENISAADSRGFVRFPMYGYIYKVSSMSSDEIWL
ncbi:transmembrane protein 25-like isoform X2 [Chiloscyllium punctatum]|uniref:transmembrane protein 25-like isoform X2 n=1 Tax=Chiloscyllium punctatum TaxID=137246 RepID=UPI003B6333EC